MDCCIILRCSGELQPCSPVVGGLSDRYGRRPVLLVSLLGFGLDYILQAFAPTIGWLFLGRALAGITGASFTTASAYIVDISSPEKRTQNFGILYSAFGLGFIIGPLIMNNLFSYFSRKSAPVYLPGAPFFAGAAMMFTAVLFAMYYLKPRLPEQALTSSPDGEPLLSAH